MEILSTEKANKAIQRLIAQPIKYGIKSPDTGLFDLGFGEELMHIDIDNANLSSPYCVHTIHFLGGIRCFWKNGKCEEFSAETSHIDFQKSMQRLYNLFVQRVALSEKMDLWLDFGQCQVVIITNEDGEESWRLFSPWSNEPHLIATNLYMYFDTY